jgi:hypothetical protein
MGELPVNTDAVQKSVVFVYAAAGNQADASKPLGTGFLVQIKLVSNPARSYEFLVTARHVIDPLWAGCPPHQNPPLVFLRFNTKDWVPETDPSGVAYVALPLSGNNKIHFDPDESVDVAVVELPFDPIRYDASPIDLSDFASLDDTKMLRASDQILSAGLLPAFPGVQRNYPIFKFGFISAIPTERIPISCAPNEPPRPLRVWLLEASLVPGNSGAPVVFVPRLFSGRRAMLLGLQSITFSGANVAGMTPVQYIYEVFQLMNLKDADLRVGPRQESSPQTQSPQAPQH